MDNETRPSAPGSTPESSAEGALETFAQSLERLWLEDEMDQTNSERSRRDKPR